MDFSIKTFSNASTQFKFQVLNALCFAFFLFNSNALNFLTSLVFVFVSSQLYLGRLNWIFFSIAVLVSEQFFLNDFFTYVAQMMQIGEMQLSGLVLRFVSLVPLAYLILIRKEILQLIPSKGDFKNENTKLLEWGMISFLVLLFCYTNFYLESNKQLLFSNLLSLSLVIYLIYYVQKSIYLSFFFFGYLILVFCEKFLIQFFNSNFELSYMSGDSIYYFLNLLPLAFLIIMYSTDFHSEKQKELMFETELSKENSEENSEEKQTETTLENVRMTDLISGLLLLFFGLSHFFVFSSFSDFGYRDEIEAREIAYIFFGLLFSTLGIWLLVGTRKGNVEVSKTILIIFSVSMGLALFRYLIIDWRSNDNMYLFLYIYFTITYLLLVIPTVRMKSSSMNKFLYTLKRNSSYLKHSDQSIIENKELLIFEKANLSLLPWHKSKTHVIILFIICFLTFYLSLNSYSLILNNSIRMYEYSDLIYLLVCICMATLFSKIVRAVLRIDNAFLYFIICYHAFGLLGNLYVFSQNIEMIYTSVGVAALIYLGIIFYAFHLIDLNKKYRKDLLSKLEGLGSNDPNVLD